MLYSVLYQVHGAVYSIQVCDTEVVRCTVQVHGAVVYSVQVCGTDIVQCTVPSPWSSCPLNSSRGIDIVQCTVQYQVHGAVVYSIQARGTDVVQYTVPNPWTAIYSIPGLVNWLGRSYVTQGDRKIRDLPPHPPHQGSAMKITVVSHVFPTPPPPGQHCLLLAERTAHSHSEWRRHIPLRY